MGIVTEPSDCEIFLQNLPHWCLCNTVHHAKKKKNLPCQGHNKGITLIFLLFPHEQLHDPSLVLSVPGYSCVDGVCEVKG